ncbi:hypothetical protein HMI56_001297 [Coelomomyces lativittatus]|nr:hypothetical protein HMI56_001297 [Coelomomyces lativittatus]
MAVGMLNNPTAIPDPLTNKWVVYYLMFDFELQYVSWENNMLTDIMICLHDVCAISPDKNTASIIQNTLEKGTYQVGQLYVNVPNPSVIIKQIKDKLTKLQGEDVQLHEYSSAHKNIIHF